MPISPEVRGALQALDKKLHKLHLTYGNATSALCFSWLTGDWGDDDQNYAGQFNKWCNRYPAIAQRFRDLVTRNTSSSQFRAFFDFYLEMVAEGTRRIFAELVRIAPASEADGIGWAKAQAGQVVRRYRRLVIDWVRTVCDHPVADLRQAPLFLTMEPAGCEPYDPGRAWEYLDTAHTSQLLDSFADEYEHRLKDCIEDAAGAAYLEATKRREPAPTERTERVFQRSESTRPLWLWELSLSVRACHVLREMGFKSREEAESATIMDLIAVPGCGRTTALEIAAELQLKPFDFDQCGKLSPFRETDIPFLAERGNILTHASYSPKR